MLPLRELNIFFTLWVDFTGFKDLNFERNEQKYMQLSMQHHDILKLDGQKERKNHTCNWSGCVWSKSFRLTVFLKALPNNSRHVDSRDEDIAKSHCASYLEIVFLW